MAPRDLDVVRSLARDDWREVGPGTDCHPCEIAWRIAQSMSDEVQLWFDDGETGSAERLIGWGWVSFQNALDTHVSSKAAAAQVHRLIVDWYEATTGGDAPRRIWILDSDDEGRRLLAGRGYEQTELAVAIMVRDGAPPNPGSLPPGLRVTGLAGDEAIRIRIDLARASLGQEMLSDPQYQRLRQQPEHHDQLDVVLIDDTGRAVAGCIGLLDTETQGILLEGLLVHPDYRGMGLSRLAVEHVLDRAAACGGSVAVVQLPTASAGAMASYRTLGFGEIDTARLHQKQDPR